MFTPVISYLPEGEKGVARVTHFQVDDSASRLSFIRLSDGVLPGSYARLHVAGRLMMSDTQMEQASNREAVRQARGDVMIAGLGIGMILIPILNKPEVTSVTVIEKYQDVVDLVLPHVMAAVGENATKIRVIIADAMDYRPQKDQVFDTIYFDIWPDICTDNLKDITTLRRRWARRKRDKGSYMGAWMEQQLRYQKTRQDRHDRMYRF